jgi:FkbM family methyltransferase
MLNLEMGHAADVGGRSCLVTDEGHKGHAVYGPYELLEPGDYMVSFSLASAAPEPPARNVRCAVIDVARNTGNDVLAKLVIRPSDLSQELRLFTLRFTLTEPARVEYRVWASGTLPLLIDGHRRVTQIAEGASDAEARLLVEDFPEAAGAAVPFFVENRAMLRGLYDQNIGVRIVDDAVVLTAKGVSLYARSHDDLIFIGEIFHEHAYNFRYGRDVCVIDIGMNIGLATLMFASKLEVREVHSFEPFPSTYQRALANLTLNPHLAAKVRAFNHGLSDRDTDGPIAIPHASDSGAMSTVSVAGGTPTELSLRDAATLLRPVIDDARARGLGVIVKMDCEGSEFAIFRSLGEAGLLPRIDAFMVEWHAMFETMTQETLIGPLQQAGFIVFDRSPPIGNGFFYAARIAA